MKILKKLDAHELGQLVGGETTYEITPAGSKTMPDGTVITWSADCKGSDGSFNGYGTATDSVPNWTPPCPA